MFNTIMDGKDECEEQMELFDAQTIDQLEWPDNPAANYAKNFLGPLVRQGLAPFIENIDASIFVLRLGSYIFPILVPNLSATCNSYVCSPYNHYLTLGRLNLSLMDNPHLVRVVKTFFPFFEKSAKLGRLDSVIYVNHWLSFTDLYPAQLSKTLLAKMIEFLEQRFPDRAIIFRSLNSISTLSLISDLSDLDLHLIASRYVYLSDTKDEALFRTRILKSDKKAWEHCPYRIQTGDFTEVDSCAQFLNLERSLYVLHHTELHPQYTEKFVRHLFEQRLLQFISLWRGDECVGVAGYMQRDGVMFCPFLGFNKADPEHNQIFRLLNIALLFEAKKHGWLFNQSAGASFFKSVRRAKGTIEYMGVYTKHLPKRQRYTWTFLARMINTFGQSCMKKY